MSFYTYNTATGNATGWFLKEEDAQLNIGDDISYIAHERVGDPWLVKVSGGVAAVDAALETSYNNNKAEAEIRAERDALLAATDIYALQDLVMTEEMKTYRQALRDVPQQAGFPTTVTWPTKPETT